MADSYDSLAKRFGFPAAQLDSWRAKAGAPPRPAPAAPSAGPRMPAPPIALPPGIDPSWAGGGPQGPALPPPPSPADPRLTEALRAANRAPGSTPSAAPDAHRWATIAPGTTAEPAPSPADQRQPLKGDWKGHNEHVQKQESARRAANLEGATFYEPGGESGGQPLSGYGGATMVSKGGRRPQSWQVQQGMDLGPDAKQANENASVRGYEAADLDFEAGKAAAEFERGYLDQHAEAAKRYADAERTRADAYTAQVDEHMSKLDGLRQQIREQGPIKPWGDGDPTIAKIGSVIAIGLGGLGASRAGGKNVGLEAVNHVISTNIREQEGKLEKLERGAKGEMNFLGALKQTYGDKKVAAEAAHIAYLEQAKAELAKQLGDPTVADPRLLAAHQRLLAGLDDELVRRTAMLKGITEDRVIRHDINAQPTFIGGGGFGAGAKSDARYLSEAYEKAGVPTALADLQGVDQLIDTFGDGEIEGVGPVVSMVPDKVYGVLGSTRGVANRQAVAGIKNRIRKSIAGASLTEGEKVELNKELESAGDADSLRRSLQSVRRRLFNQQKNIGGGASPEGHMLYRLQGGSVPNMRLDKGTTPTIREAK